MSEDLVQYIRANRDRYTREAITAVLVGAGHDPAAIEAAWALVAIDGGASASDARPRTRYIAVFVPLLVLGGALVFLVGSGMYLVGPFWGISYLITAVVVISISVGLTALASGRGWIVAVALGAAATAAMAWISISLNAVENYPGWIIATLVGLIATVTAYAVHRYRIEVPALAYALPFIGWLVVTGICVSPLIAGG